MEKSHTSGSLLNCDFRVGKRPVTHSAIFKSSLFLTILVRVVNSSTVFLQAGLLVLDFFADYTVRSRKNRKLGTRMEIWWWIVPSLCKMPCHSKEIESFPIHFFYSGDSSKIVCFVFSCKGKKENKTSNLEVIFPASSCISVVLCWNFPVDYPVNSLAVILMHPKFQKFQKCNHGRQCRWKFGEPTSDRVWW